MTLPNKERVLVTGASGYVGSNAAFLFAKQGHDVFATSRDKKNLESIFEGSPVSVKSLDIHSAEDTQHLIESLRPAIVIHAAGMVGIDGYKKMDVFLKGNALTTKNVVDACTAAKTNIHFVHISTIGVYSERENNKGKVVNEITSRVKNTNIPYIDSKVISEEIVENAVINSDGRIKSTILRPGMIYGNVPDSYFSSAKKFVPRILGLAKSPLGIPIIGGGNSPANVTHIENLLFSLKTIVEEQTSTHDIYDVVDNELYSISMGEYLSALLKKYSAANGGIDSMSIPAARYTADMSEQLQDASSNNPLPFSRLLTILLGDSPYVEGGKIASIMKNNKDKITSLEQGLSTI